MHCILSETHIALECGRLPMYIDSQIRCIKYWLKLIEMPNFRYAKKCYTMLKYYDTNNKNNWVSHVKNILNSNGFGYVWDRQSVANKNLFINQFQQRLKDQYMQDWHNIVQ